MSITHRTATADPTPIRAPKSGDGPATRIGVLLVNLGTPDAPTPRAVRRFLREMLSDPRLVELPRLLWLPILHGLVLPLRPRRSALAYRKIWTSEGSPQLVIGRRLADRLAAMLSRHLDSSLAVAIAMTYGSPSIPDALARLWESGVRRIIVLPLYPQYASVTTASAFDRITNELRRWHSGVPELRFINGYHDDPAYIDALRASVAEYWDREGRDAHLLMSFHGMPQRLVERGDPYYRNVQRTAELLAQALALRPPEWSVSFQSRFGYQEWLRPYTDEALADLAARGIRRVTVACPGFAVDCLESLEEIAMTARERFIAAGGERLAYVPALNERTDHVEFLARLIARNCEGWR
jgi:ferrochelatase